jgi:hypothetical protein
LNEHYEGDGEIRASKLRHRLIHFFVAAIVLISIATKYSRGVAFRSQDLSELSSTLLNSGERSIFAKSD